MWYHVAKRGGRCSMATEAQIRASTKYNRKQDTITVRVDKETGKKIRDAAERQGVSVKEFILAAVMPHIDDK
jgi:uncharacterized protein (DUF1778 family)|nr:MAG TPA: hypothetical protein [Caudoviricetes sp.]